MVKKENIFIKKTVHGLSTEGGDSVTLVCNEGEVANSFAVSHFIKHNFLSKSQVQLSLDTKSFVCSETNKAWRNHVLRGQAVQEFILT
jgi:hypothetical protein